MQVCEVMKKMIEYSEGNVNNINHLLKVYAYAKTIGELENLSVHDQFILETAAVIHDIACPLCRRKYGDVDGKHQEIESEALVREFFRDEDLAFDVLERLVFLVSHHHTYTNVEGMDHQILLEADYLVNADESNHSREQIENAASNIFKTEAGTALLRSIYPGELE